MAVQERGPVGNTRSVPLSMLWYILTLGIYGLVWAYRTHEEMKRYSGNGLGGVLGLVVWLVASIVSVFILIPAPAHSGTIPTAPRAIRPISRDSRQCCRGRRCKSPSPG